jgi:hypothetical protein
VCMSEVAFGSRDMRISFRETIQKTFSFENNVASDL